jgi:hypothetical protein
MTELPLPPAEIPIDVGFAEREKSPLTGACGVAEASFDNPLSPALFTALTL